MKPTTFGNKKALQIISNDIKNNIKTDIKKLSQLELNTRYYNFLNEKNMHILKEGDYKVSINTYGHKYFLFLTKINEKNYPIFINKKREDMIYIRFRFEDSLYENTLFDGELIKNTNNEWVYVINDLILYKGDNVLKNKTLSERYNLLKEIFTDYYYRDDIMDVCKIDIKDIFSLNYLKDLSDSYIKSVPYKISGIFIQSEEDYKKSFMYIFPENRSRDNAKGDTLPLDTISLDHPKDKIDTSSSSAGTIEIKKSPPASTSTKSKIDINKEFNFKIKPTDLPDVYELYCYNKIGKEIRYGYAGVPNLEISQLLSGLFVAEKDKELGLIMKCQYSEQFDKWIPIEISNAKIDKMI